MNIQQIQEKLGFLVIRIEPYYQSLELGYIPERAVKTLGLGQIPLTYYIGQTLVTAQKA